jgi:GAF domain-containing protein
MVTSVGAAMHSIEAPGRAAEPDHYRRFLQLLDSQETAPALEKLTAEVRQGVATGELPQTMVDDVEIVLRLHDNFENKRKREKELSALYETARDLSALRNTDQVLQAIVQRARQLVGSDIAYISAADDERNDFYVRATEGVISQDFARIRVPRDIGVCGSVARTRRPFYSSNYATDVAFAHDNFIDHATEGEGVVSILGIPLEVEAHVIGVLFVGDRYARSYTPNEMAVLSSLGTFAALAIENAKLLEEARRALQAAKEANAALKAKAEDIENAAAAHEQLTELIARGGTLDDLTERVSRMLNGQAAVLEERQKPISGTLPDGISAEALIRAVRESDRLGRSVQVHCDDGGVALVAAAIGGTARLGSLVFKRRKAFSAAEVRTFERSAIVTGIVLLSLERIAQSAHKNAADAISALVRGTSDSFASGTPRQIPGGTAVAWPVTMMIVELGDRSYMQVSAPARAALSRRDTIFAEFGGDLVVITSSDAPRELAGKLSERLFEATQARFSVAVSEPIGSIHDAPLQYEALRRCLGLIRGLGQSGRIVFERSMSVYAMLFGDKRSDAVTAFVSATIGPILDADARKGSHLAQTLLGYLDEGRSLQKAADRVGIHVNTMRQRLDLIGQINAASLNAEQGLETHLALRMHFLKQVEQRL